MGRDRQLACGLDWPDRRTDREAVCTCWGMQEPVPGICAGGSILSVCVEKEKDFNILVFKPFSPCLIVSCDCKPKLTSHAPAGQVVSVHKRRHIYSRELATCRVPTALFPL